MPEVANGINTWKKSSTCFWLPLESFIKIVLTLFSLFVELVCQQPHDQYSDQFPEIQNLFRLLQAQLPWADNLFWVLQRWMSICSSKTGPSSSKEHGSPGIAFGGQEETKMFTVILCRCSGEFSVLFLLPQDAHIDRAELCHAHCSGCCGDSMEHFRATRWCWSNSHGWQATHQPLEKNIHQKVENVESDGNIVFCRVKAVVTFSQKIVPTAECPFIWRESKKDKSGASAFPYTVPVCGPLQPCCLLSLPTFFPPTRTSPFHPKKHVYVCKEVRVNGRNEQFLMEALYPNYPSCGFTSRP